MTIATTTGIAYAAPGNSSVAKPDTAVQLQAFFGSHCASCHGKKEPKGDVVLSPIDDAQWNNANFLNDILSVLDYRTMPPKDAKKKLPDDERSRAIKLLKTHLDGITASAAGNALIRLNRTEYQNTINDVFGTETDANKPFLVYLTPGRQLLLAGSRFVQKLDGTFVQPTSIDKTDGKVEGKP
jgi:cytochrome c5